ncbi:hypothetical protein AMK59_8298, partial [Oryctes borbonicus]
MLNQVSVEAVYSATYVENYLDCVENLPDELQRLISRMRELDVYYLARVRELENQTQIWKNAGNENSGKKTRAAMRMQQALIAAQELGDEKMSLLQSILERIEMKTRLLDQDFKNLDFGKDETTLTDNKEQQPPVNNTSSSTSLTNNERPNKRARRTRQDTFSGLESNHNSNSADHVLRSQVTNNTNAQKKSNTGINAITCDNFYILTIISQVPARKRNERQGKRIKLLNVKNLHHAKKKQLLIQMNQRTVCAIKYHS